MTYIKLFDIIIKKLLKTGESRVRECRDLRILGCKCFECGRGVSFAERENALLLAAVISGWLKVKINGEDLLLGENNLIIKSETAAMSASLGKNERATLLIIEFESREFKGKDIFERIIPLGKTKRRYIGEILREMSRAEEDETELYFEPTGESRTYGESIIIGNALSSLLVRITRDSLGSLAEDSGEDFEIRNKAQAVRRYLYENYKNRITLDSLCFIFKTNKTTICKQFREEYGMTVLSYLNSLRIKEAKRLLLEERLSVTEIADVLGFESIHYFTKFFKKATAKTPTEYSRVVGQRQKFIENEWRAK